MQARRILVIVVVFIAAVSAVLSFYLLEREETRRVAAERVVVVSFSGPIMETRPLGMTGAITPQDVRRALSTIADDRSIDAVVMRIDTSGGSVAASQEISSMVEDFHLPVVVSMADMAASGGYYIAAASDGIVAHPGTMTGSIGVILTVMNLEGLYEKLGIDVEVIKSGEHKDMMQRALTEEERGILQELSDEAYGQFVDHVAESRDMDPARVRELATGEIFMGSQAYEHGLVDELGGEEEAIQLAGEVAGLNDPERYELPSPSPFQLLHWLAVDARSALSGLLLPEEMRWIEMFEEYIYPRINY